MSTSPTEYLQKANLWIGSLLIILFLITIRSDAPIIVATGTILAFIEMFFLAGANSIYLIQKKWNITLDLATFVTLSILSSLFFIPFLVLGIYKLSGQVNSWIPLIAYIALHSIPWVYKRKEAWPLVIGKTVTSWKLLLIHPLLIGALFVFAVHAYNVTRYPFLSVLDPYSWLIALEKVDTAGTLTVANDRDRPLYFSLIVSFHYLSGASYWIITKYIFPFLALLAIPPLYLAARKLHGIFQYIFIFCALTSPVIIFELEIVRQQIVALIHLYFVVGISIAYAYNPLPILFYMTGASAFIGSIYHPLFFIPAAAWIVTLLVLHRRYIWQNKVKGALLIILFIPWLEKVQLTKILGNIALLGKKLVSRFFQGNQNWNFPAQYVNIDQNPVGWAGASGVIKYYAFYAGVLSLAIIAFLFLLLLQKRFRKFIYSRILSPMLIMPGILILFFFVVAEVAPRTSNIAYLLDRAWQALSILLLAPLFGILLYLLKNYSISVFIKNIPVVIICIALTINIFGPGYVTYISGFTTPQYEWEAAQWIMRELPKDRIIFSASSKNLLRYHTSSNRIHLEAEYFLAKDAGLIVNHLTTLLGFQDRTNKPLNPTGITSKTLEDAENTPNTNTSYDNTNICTPGYLSYVAQTIAVQCSPAKESKQEVAEKPVTPVIPDAYKNVPIYLYYAKTHPRNPYIDRPYEASFTGNRNEYVFPALDTNSDIFEKIYDNGDVFIWKVHLDK